MFLWNTLVCIVTVSCIVDAVPIVFKESTPNGESIVAISSSDPNVEKYLSQQFATRSGFTQINSGDSYRNAPGNVHSSISIAVPGKAIAGSGRSFASASSGPFLPLFAFPINPDFSFNNFPDLKDWVRNFESHYDPNFPGNQPKFPSNAPNFPSNEPNFPGQIYTATAVNDNGHVYGKVNTVTFDNRDKSPATYKKSVESKQ